jgi:hypothetical protein
MNRHAEIDAEIDRLLAEPMPPPAEKHLLREKIFALKYEQLGLNGLLPEPEQDQQARDFTLARVPQNVHSYPMHLRETRMSVRRDGPSTRPTQAPTTPERIEANRAALFAKWGGA